MTEKKKRIREKVGQVFQVPLGDKTFGYGQVVTMGSMVFFNYQDKGTNFNLEEIIQQPIIFKVTVDSYVIKDGIWCVLGNLPVNPKLQEKQFKFTYDITKKVYLIWRTILKQEVATPEEIYNLECFASWGPHHVERRLRDHFAGRPNYTVELFRNEHNPNFERDIKKFYKQYGYDYKSDDE